MRSMDQEHQDFEEKNVPPPWYLAEEFKLAVFVSLSMLFAFGSLFVVLYLFMFAGR